MYCFFEAGEKTVTNSYDVIADTIRPDDDNITFGNATVPTSIVNATAPSPSVSFLGCAALKTESLFSLVFNSLLLLGSQY